MSKQITRKYIERVSKANNRKNVRQSSGGGGGGGGASQFWVEDNYISKLFFNRLFTVLDEDGNAIEPNDTNTVIESIQSMFGFGLIFTYRHSDKGVVVVLPSPWGGSMMFS